LVKRMIGAGKLGRKSGEGFHAYGNNKIFGA
jgi:3-hydroxybutyryl-CoA dehydrogenase